MPARLSNISSIGDYQHLTQASPKRTLWGLR